ncbi:MAG: septal ring lytic transglycosylase RlpA family protein [Rickettsiales bacterium]
MKKIYKIFTILLIFLVSSCAFDGGSSSSKYKRRYSKNIDSKFRSAGKVFAKKIRPTESMQAGIPKKTPLNFLSSDSYGYNNNYRDYKIPDNDNKNSVSRNKNSEFKTVDDVDDFEDDEFADNNSIDKNNILQSGVYSGHFKIGKPYTAFGVSYTPQDYESFEEIGTASWYGSDFHGKKTANGEIYNMGDLTAAHPTLPLPSLIKITNLSNGKTQILRVNDRGPFAKNRIIDVSERAAELLGFKGKGTTQVKVELLRDDTDQLLEKLQIKN